MKKIFISGACIFLSLFTTQVFAATIELPEEELARDTVLPIFDTTKVVRNRSIMTKGRFEFSGGLGLNMTEALYEQTMFQLGLSYNFTETHAAGLWGFFIQDGLSNNGQSLKNGEGDLNGAIFDPTLAPHPESMILADYQFTAWYGKVSVTKKSVMNLSLYGILGLNTVSFGDSNTFGLHIGFGQKFYFGKHIAFRYDFRTLAYKGPNPADDKTSPGTPLDGGNKRTSDELGEITYFPMILNLGLVFIL